MLSGVALFHHLISLCWTDTPICLEITRVTQANIYLAWTRKRHSNGTCLPDVSKRRFMAGALSLFSERADCLFIFPCCLSQKNLDMMLYTLTKCVFRKPISDDVWDDSNWNITLSTVSIWSTLEVLFSQHALLWTDESPWSFWSLNFVLCQLIVGLRTYFIYLWSSLFNPH